MTLSPQTIHAGKGSRRKSKRVGRGNASQKGTTAARGTKGQRARSGGRSRTKILGFRQSLLKIPKNRGFKSMYAKPAAVTLNMLNRAEEGVDITPAYLKEKGLVPRTALEVKILATGELKKKLTIKDCLASKGAVVAIEKAGGTVTF